MKIFKKTALYLLIAHSLMAASVKGTEIPFVEVEESQIHSTVSAPSYFERIGQAFGCCSEKVVLGTQQVCKTLYRNRVPLFSGAVALTAFYLLPTVNALTAQEYFTAANGAAIADGTMEKIAGFCPTSLRFEDFFNQALVGKDGSPMILQDGHKLFELKENTFVKLEYSEDLLPGFLRSTQEEWLDEVKLYGGQYNYGQYKGYVKGAEKIICDCYYLLYNALNEKTFMSVAYRVFSSSVPVQASVPHDIL